MMDSATLKLIRQQEGILLEHPKKGFLVSDRLGHRFCSGVANKPKSSFLADFVLDLFSRPQDTDMDVKDKERMLQMQSMLSLTIFVSEAAFHGVGTADAVSRLLEMCERNQITLTIDLPKGPSSWESLWQFLKVVRAVKNVSLKISLQGSFICNDEGKKQLARYGVFVRWPLGFAGETSVEEDQLAAIRNFSEFGIPVLSTLYIGRHNVQNAKKWLKRLLPASLYSGFSILPTFQRPEFPCSSVAVGQCDADEYLALLVDVYKEFPYYDGLCFPINEMADSVAFGGWNEELQIPRFMQMAIMENGAIRLYRHIPTMAFQWINCSKVLNMSKESLRDAFLSTLSNHFGKKSQKTDCQLLSLCGCTDGIACGRNPESRFVCHYRRMFIEAFLWQKHMLQQMIEERSNQEENHTKKQAEPGDQQSLATA